MSSGVKPRPDCSRASSRPRSHIRMRSLPGSFRARTSLRTRPDVGVGKLAESEAIACRENWTVMIAFLLINSASARE
jgi:hypothetical protein